MLQMLYLLAHPLRSKRSQHRAESAAAAQPVPDRVWPVIDRQLLLRPQQKPGDHNWMQIGWERT